VVTVATPRRIRRWLQQMLSHRASHHESVTRGPTSRDASGPLGRREGRRRATRAGRWVAAKKSFRVRAARWKATWLYAVARAAISATRASMRGVLSRD